MRIVHCASALCIAINKVYITQHTQTHIALCVEFHDEFGVLDFVIIVAVAFGLSHRYRIQL